MSHWTSKKKPRNIRSKSTKTLLDSPSLETVKAQLDKGLSNAITDGPG